MCTAAGATAAGATAAGATAAGATAAGYITVAADNDKQSNDINKSLPAWAHTGPWMQKLNQPMWARC